MTGNGSPPRRKKQNIDVVLHLPALSTNKLYAGVKRRSHHYKTYRKRVFKILNEYDSNVNLKGNLSLYLEVGFSSPLSDLSNAIKGLEDLLCEYFRFDDRQIVHIEMNKFLVNKGEEYIKAQVKKSRKNIDRRSKKSNRRNK